MLSLNDKFINEGLTFDDVLVLPGYSEVLPRETNTATQLTKNLRLNIPIISAAMDTVTEFELAIAIAREGGLGILHKNMTIEQQAMQVRKVKRAESGMILDPITLLEDQVIEDAMKIMRDNRIGGIPVIDAYGKLKGIITNRDLRFEKDFTRKIYDVMTKDGLITAPEKTDFDTAEKLLQEYKIEKLPVVDKNNKLVGLITYKDILKVKSNPNACKDNYGRLRVGAAVGVTADSQERIEALIKAGADTIIIDTAHGHSKGVVNELKKAISRHPGYEFIVGNVATYDGAKALVEAGASAVKVGVGPGSICTTRIIAGIGVPQLTAISEASRACKPAGVSVIADGGIRYSGDIVKAIVAGADCIMAGSLFAGVEESPGSTIIFDGRKVKSYRGMGSIEAMEKGSKDRYFQDAEEEISKLVPEGIVGHVPFKGVLKEVMYQYIGGLRAGMGYCGAATITDLQKAKFIRITGAGMKESHPHDVFITKEAPNYSR
jgi:IMP dehydrogenase